MPTIKFTLILFTAIGSHLFITETQTKAIFVENQDTATFKFSISEDSSFASFAIYRKDTRKSDVKTHKKSKTSGKKKYAIDESSAVQPDMQYNFISTQKPYILGNLDNEEYITINEFRNNESKYLKHLPKYIILKSNGKYLKWKVTLLPKE